MMVTELNSPPDLPIGALKAWELISTRTYNALANTAASPQSPFPAGISVSDIRLSLIAPLSPDDLLSIYQLGLTSLFDLIEAMTCCGWKLGGAGADRLYDAKRLTRAEGYDQGDARRHFRMRRERLDEDRRMAKLMDDGVHPRDIGREFDIYESVVRTRVTRYRQSEAIRQLYPPPPKSDQD